MDYSQIAGVTPLDLSNKNIDIVCCSGHKGLLGLSGVGLLLINNDIIMNTIIEGGTGGNSENPFQPTELPDRFESGTPNIVGIVSLSKSIDYLNEIGINNVYKHEMKLLKYFQYNLFNEKNVKFYTSFNVVNIKFPFYIYSMLLYSKNLFLYRKYLQLLLNLDVHGPSILRANMPPRNFPEWYETFDVKETDQMYIEPSKRVVIW